MSELVVRPTGQLVNLEDPVEVAQGLYDLAELEHEIKLIKRALVDALEPVRTELGKSTLELGDYEVSLTGNTKTEYDLELLAELLTDAGLPEQRLTELIVLTVTSKLNRSVARQVAGANPAYANALERSKSELPATVYATVKRVVAHADR